MTDHLPYDFETIDRVALDDTCYVVIQAERWRDSDGNYVHTVIAVSDDAAGESMTVLINSVETARRLKNLFAKVERRLT